MMKKQLTKTILFLCGLVLLSACLKDDPENNATVFYGYQQIPNINEFIPQELLIAFGEENLYYGDEPPKLEGSYIADSIMILSVGLAPGSRWVQAQSEFPASIPTPQYFNFHEQHKGIAKLEFRYPKGHPGDYTYYLERSDVDTTHKYVTADPEHFINDTIAPSYFQNGHYNEENFRTVYIMGKDPYFTIYYYEIRDISTKALPLNAVVFSGKLDHEYQVVTDTVANTTDTIEMPVIKNLKWGIETMKYYHESTSLDQILHFGYLPNKGDYMILESRRDARIGEYHE